MAKNSLNDWSTTPANNTDIAGTNIDVGCPPQDVGVYMRTCMAQIAYGVQGSGGAIPATWHVGGQAISGKLGVGLSIIPTDFFLHIVVNGTASATNQALISGYQPAWELFNQAGTQNWYMGINDADSSALYIGRGYSAGQGLTPSIRVGTGDLVSMGTVSPQGATRLTVDNTGAGTATIASRQTGTSQTDHIGFFNANGQVGGVTTNGSGTLFNTSSDYRLKIVHGPAKPVIGRLRVYEASFKSDPDVRRSMFLAHELVEDGAGFAVTGEKDGERMQMVDHSALIPDLIAYVQKLEARIAALEAKL